MEISATALTIVIWGALIAVGAGALVLLVLLIKEARDGDLW